METIKDSLINLRDTLLTTSLFNTGYYFAFRHNGRVYRHDGVDIVEVDLLDTAGNYFYIREDGRIVTNEMRMAGCTCALDAIAPFRLVAWSNHADRWKFEYAVTNILLQSGCTFEIKRIDYITQRVIESEINLTLMGRENELIDTNNRVAVAYDLEFIYKRYHETCEIDICPDGETC